MAARLAFFKSLMQEKRPMRKDFDARQIYWICEMMWNLLRGNVPLYKSSEYKLLKKHQSSVEAIARAKQVNEARRLIALHGEQVVVPFLRAVVSLLSHEKVRPHSGRSRASRKA